VPKKRGSARTKYERERGRRVCGSCRRKWEPENITGGEVNRRRRLIFPSKEKGSQKNKGANERPQQNCERKTDHPENNNKKRVGGSGKRRRITDPRLLKWNSKIVRGYRRRRRPRQIRSGDVLFPSPVSGETKSKDEPHSNDQIKTEEATSPEREEAAI